MSQYKVYHDQHIRVLSFTFITIVCSAIFFNACTPSYWITNHPTVVQDAMQFKINRIEKRVADHPDDPILLLDATTYLTRYAYGFVLEQADRSIVEDYKKGKELFAQSFDIFIRAINYGMTSLRIKYPNLDDWVENPREQSLVFSADDVPLLYWTGAAWAGAISSSRGDPTWLIHIPKVGLFFEAALALDPEWDKGSLYSAMISYSINRPDAGRDAESIAISFFQKAIKASGGNACSPYVAYAENISIKNQNKDEFVSMLNKALKINPKSDPDLKLANIIAQNRARWLLSRIDELFY